MAKKQTKQTTKLQTYKISDFLTPKIWIKKNTLFFGSNITIREAMEVLKLSFKDVCKILDLNTKEVETEQFLTTENIAELAIAKKLSFEAVQTISEMNVLASIDKLVKNSIFYHKDQLKKRPPIVTIMGHVDHGKTTLLDYIKKTNITASEIGGITQKIGAYTIEQNGEKITFIDTPGHEAFTNMRANGSKVTDIVVIVVAADDKIMPQTKESIDHAKAANVPMIVAINKIDKHNADVERIKNEVSDYGLMPEEWGGDVPFVEISALNGTGVDTLLETILLQSELLELKASYDIVANGTVLESNVDIKKGSMISIIVRDGILKTGDYLFINENIVKIKAMYNASMEQIKIAYPSESVELFGLGIAPASGSKFSVINDLKDTKKIIYEIKLENETLASEPKVLSLDDIFNVVDTERILKIILKAKSFGSLTALKEELIKIDKPHGKVEIIRADIGEVTNSDISLAEASQAKIYTFELSSKYDVNTGTYKVQNFNIIYELIEEVNNIIDGLKKVEYIEEYIGEFKILKMFESSKHGIIIGGSVTSGTIPRDGIVKIFNHQEKELFKSKIKTLKIEKNNVKEVKVGKEFGIIFEDMDYDFQEESIIKVYKEVEKSE